jgi:hypothetical protein
MIVPVGKERVWPSGQSRNPARDTTKKMDTQIWTFDDANILATIRYTAIRNTAQCRMENGEWRMEVSHQHQHLGPKYIRCPLSVEKIVVLVLSMDVE